MRMAAGLRQGSTWRNQPPEQSRNVAIGDGKDTRNLNQRVSSVYRECGCVVELGTVVWWGLLERKRQRHDFVMRSERFTLCLRASLQLPQTITRREIRLAPSSQPSHWLSGAFSSHAGWQAQSSSSFSCPHLLHRAARSR
jgi:hypothetical protein